MPRHAANTLRAALLGAVCAATMAGSALASPARFEAADVAATVAAAQHVEFDVFMPLRDKPGLETLLLAQQDPASASYHRWITPAEFGARFGATDATVASVTAELTAHGMGVERWARSLHVTATAAAIREAFGTDLSLVRGQTGARIVALNGLRLPPALQAAEARVFAFLPRRAEAQPNSRIIATALPDNRTAATGGYYYNDLKQAYCYPAFNAIKPDTASQRLNGTGATIGVLMSSDVNTADIAKMFSLQTYTAAAAMAAPTLYARVLVDGGATTASSAFDEASLDVQMELGGAPGAHVMLYEIPALSDDGIIDGYTRIIHDNLVDAVSSSFGECERAYTAAYNDGTDYTPILAQEHELFEQGNAQGITFLASSGDAAAKQCPSLSYFQGGTGTFQPGAASPATDPNVTGVGGTNLVTSTTAGSLNSAYAAENAYSDPEKPYDAYGTGKTVSGGIWGAGGGASIYFATPSWQTANGATMRTTPDIGMQVGGCPSIADTPCNGGNTAVDGNGNTQRSFAEVVLNNVVTGLIGTSVASPEFASVVALMVELHGRQGNLNPYLYSLRGTAAYHLGIPGYNGIQSTSTPSATYNYSVGLGTPVTRTLIGAPAATALAGVPHTASNP
jgi:subtilase family serine protease